MKYHRLILYRTLNATATADAVTAFTNTGPQGSLTDPAMADECFENETRNFRKYRTFDVMTTIGPCINGRDTRF